MAWVDSAGNLVQGPLNGGAKRTVWTQGVQNQPSMSPDGTRFLWWYPVENLTYTRRLTVGASETDGVSSCFCVVTHGWLGATPIGTFEGEPSRGVPGRICRMATPDEAPGISASCVEVLAADARGALQFPSGNAQGTEIVATLEPGVVSGGATGRIVRYSVATGALIADVTEGTDDTTPYFSNEGDRVVFERSNQIVVKDLASGGESVIGPGAYPFWGGARTIRIRVAKRVGTTALRRGRVAVRVPCPAAYRVRGELAVTRGTARRLALGRTRTIAAGSASRRSAGTASLRLKATRKARKRIAELRSYRTTLRVTIRPRGGQAIRSTASVRVRR